MYTFATIIQANSGKLILAMFSGALLTAAFPRIGAWYAAWGALVFLFLALRDAGPKKGFWLGFMAGFVHYLSLLYWLVPTMRVYGYLPLPVSVLALVLLAGYLALYPALFAAALSGLCRHPALMLPMVPLSWVSLEYVRSIILSGFPWGLVGYSQFSRLHLIQMADVFGVYGVSGIVMLGNAALFMLVLAVSGKRWQGFALRPAGAAAAVLLLVAALGSAWMYGKMAVSGMDARAANADGLNTAVIQGNIDQAQKWDRTFRRQTLDKYFRLSGKAPAPSPDLVVWPETAAPFYFNYDAGAREKFQERVAALDRAFLIGTLSADTDGRVPAEYNSAYLLGRDGAVLGRYDKVHLVPFGEYVPFHQWLPFIDTLVAQTGNFEAGRKGTVLAWEEADIGILICYEAIFPRLSAEMAANGADFLVNMTNDAWFGKTSAPYQHFSMAVFRAIENRRALVRAANTGISGFVDPVGRITETSGLFADAVLSRRIALIRDYETVYTRYKDLPALACLVATGGIFVLLFLFSVKTKRFPRIRGSRED